MVVGLSEEQDAEAIDVRLVIWWCVDTVDGGLEVPACEGRERVAEVHHNGCILRI